MTVETCCKGGRNFDTVTDRDVIRSQRWDRVYHRARGIYETLCTFPLTLSSVVVAAQRQSPPSRGGGIGARFDARALDVGRFAMRGMRI